LILVTAKTDNKPQAEKPKPQYHYATNFSITVVLLAAIVSTCMYYLNDRKLMAANIENAITKGIDPLSVRCSYARDYDTICVAYAATSKK
jgi:hypothetical protein